MHGALVGRGPLLRITRDGPLDQNSIGRSSSSLRYDDGMCIVTDEHVFF
jgi:hypothetical protein